MKFSILCAFIAISIQGGRYSAALTAEAQNDSEPSSTTPLYELLTLSDDFPSTTEPNINSTTSQQNTSVTTTTGSTIQNNFSTSDGNFSSTEGSISDVSPGPGTSTQASGSENNSTNDENLPTGTTRLQYDSSTANNNVSSTDAPNVNYTTSQPGTSTNASVSGDNSTNTESLPPVTIPTPPSTTPKNDISETQSTIFDAVFQTGSKNDLLTTLDPIKLYIKNNTLENINHQPTEFKKIIYHDIVIEQINQSTDMSRFVFRRFKQYIEIRLTTIPKIIKIEGLFRMEIKNTKKDIVGNFTIIFENPVLVKTISSTGISNYSIEQDDQYIQVTVTSPPQHYLAVAGGLDAALENIKDTLFHHDISQLVEDKFNQFRAAFPSLDDVLASKLQMNHTFAGSTPNFKKRELFVIKSRPVWLYGIGVLEHVEINVFKVDHSDELLAYDAEVKTAPLSGYCKWFYKSNQAETRGYGYDFETDDMKLYVSVPPKSSQVGHYDSNGHLRSDHQDDVIVSFNSIRNSAANDTCENNSTQFIHSFLSWDLQQKLERHFIELLRTKYRTLQDS